VHDKSTSSTLPMWRYLVHIFSNPLPGEVLSHDSVKRLW
jgi:hypothetical protein